MSAGTPPEERIYGNRYVIQSKIARGGMADVFLAQDRLLDRPVALKVLFPELSIDPNFVERFRREAQNAAKLSHPNIVSVYDWGEEDNVYYIVMEYVEGKTLSVLLREGGPLEVTRAAAIGAETASALSFAHRNGVVHRDVKPGNVLIDSRGAVKVTDFGIARARNATENLTQTGAVMGTATYFSPEQAQGMAVDERSDVYSLGVVLYEIVAGKPPFIGDNPVAIAYKHVREQATPLHEINPQVPQDYEAIVNEAMAKAATHRYQTAEDLRADLVRFTRGQQVHAHAVVAPVNATQAIPRVTRAQTAYGESTRMVPAAPVAPRPAPEPKGGIKGPLLALIGLLTVLAIGALILLTDNPLTRDSSNDTVAVPNVVNAKLADAQSTLTAAGFDVTVAHENNDAAADTVIRQNPAANADAATGSEITLTVSDGPAALVLSSYTGQSQAAATSALQALGLTVATTQANSDQIAAGNVISQDPAGGRSVKKGDRVTLTISSGAQQVEVPDVVNSTQATAEQLLLDAGLRTRTITQDSNQREGTVIETNPSAQSQVDKNSVVTITVSNGPRNTTTSSTTTTTDGNGSGSGSGNSGSTTTTRRNGN